MTIKRFLKEWALLFAAICICNAVSYGQMDKDSDSMQHNVTLNEVAIYANTDLRNTDTQQVQQATDNIIQHIPGAALIRRGNYAPEPVLRGMNGGQINITIDGMKMFGACTDKMDPISSYIEPNNLESIHIAFTPDEAAQGIGIGGGVDFQLKQPRMNSEQEWSGLAGVQYGTNGNAVQTLAALQYSLPHFAVLVNGLYRSSQDYTAGNNRKIDYSQYDKWNGNAAAMYQINQHHEISANFLRDEGYNIGYPALLMDVQYAKASIGSLTWNYRNDEKKMYSIITKLYANYINHAMDDTKRPKWQAPVHMDMPGTSQTIGGYSSAYFQLNKTNRINAKGEFYQNRLHAEMTMHPDNASPMFMLTIPDGVRNEATINLSDKIQASNKWSLDIGTKAAYNVSEIATTQGRQQLSSLYRGSPGRHNFLWNLYGNIRYRHSDNLSFQLNLAHGMRNATLQEYYAVYIFNRIDNYDYVGNPSLKNELSLDATLSASYNHSFLHINGSVYGYKIQNYIAGTVAQDNMPMTNGASGVKQYVNLASAVIYGASVSLKLKLAHNLSFTSSNHFIYGADANNNALPMIAPFQSINSLTYIYKGFSGKLEGISNAAQYHVSNYYGETASPAFSIFNFSIAKTFSLKTNRIACALAINNILDKNYFEHLDVSAIPQPGRSFIASITYMF